MVHRLRPVAERLSRGKKFIRLENQSSGIECCLAMERLRSFIAGMGWLSFYLFLIVIPLDVATHFPVSYWWPGIVENYLKVLMYACPASMFSALVTVKLMRRLVKP